MLWDEGTGVLAIYTRTWASLGTSRIEGGELGQRYFCLALSMVFEGTVTVQTQLVRCLTTVV